MKEGPRWIKALRGPEGLGPDIERDLIDLCEEEIREEMDPIPEEERSPFVAAQPIPSPVSSASPQSILTIGALIDAMEDDEQENALIGRKRDRVTSEMVAEAERKWKALKRKLAEQRARDKEALRDAQEAFRPSSPKINSLCHRLFAERVESVDALHLPPSPDDSVVVLFTVHFSGDLRMRCTYFRVAGEAAITLNNRPIPKLRDYRHGDMWRDAARLLWPSQEAASLDSELNCAYFLMCTRLLVSQFLRAKGVHSFEFYGPAWQSLI